MSAQTLPVSDMGFVSDGCAVPRADQGSGLLCRFLGLSPLRASRHILVVVGVMADKQTCHQRCVQRT